MRFFPFFHFLPTHGNRRNLLLSWNGKIFIACACACRSTHPYFCRFQVHVQDTHSRYHISDASLHRKPSTYVHETGYLHTKVRGGFSVGGAVDGIVIFMRSLGIFIRAGKWNITADPWHPTPIQAAFTLKKGTLARAVGMLFKIYMRIVCAPRHAYV